MHGPIPALERAFEQQRLLAPDDGEALDRMLEYLQHTRPTMMEITDCVCEFYDLLGGEVLVGSRLTEVVFARHMLCFLAYKYTRHSLPVIARRLGYRDHTTVHHAVRKIEKWSLTQPLVRDDVDVLRLRIAEKVLQRAKGEASC
jgi:chromosomal replication initiator protein